MPTIFKNKFGYWQINYVLDDKRYKPSFGKGMMGKKLAEKRLAEIIDNINKQKLGIIKDIPAEEFFVEYLSYSQTNKAKSSHQRDLGIIDNFYHVIKGKNLSEIGAKEIEIYKRDRLKPKTITLKKEGDKPREIKIAKSTVNRELNTIKAAFNVAVEWGHLKSNPVKFVKKFKEPRSLLRYFTVDEIKTILNVIDNPRIKTIIYLLFMTGMRRDELVHLEWSDIDFKRNRLHIQPKPDWNPKDYEARVIPINNQVRDALRQLPRDSKFVFGNYHPHSLSRIFRRALKKAGIEGGCLHTLRHTYASYLVMAGTDLATVQKLLGHSKIETTMRYAHLAPEHLQKSVENLDKYLGRFWDVPSTKEDKTGQVVNLAMLTNQ